MNNTNLRIKETENNITENNITVKNKINKLTSKIDKLKRDRPKFEAGLLAKWDLMQKP